MTYAVHAKQSDSLTELNNVVGKYTCSRYGGVATKAVSSDIYVVNCAHMHIEAKQFEEGVVSLRSKV